MRPVAVRCARILLLSCCWPFGVMAAKIPWPMVSSQYPHAVQYEVGFTNGSSNAGTLLPCGSPNMVPQGVSSFGASSKRVVFVEQLTIRRGGVVVASFDGKAVEAASQWAEDAGGEAVIDESGLRRAARTRCVRVLNTLPEDLQARVVYKDGSESLRTWRSCAPYVLADRDIALPGRRRNAVARIVVMRHGEVLHQVERKAFKKLLKAHRKESYAHCPWLHLLVVDESGIKALPASELVSAELDFRRFCAKREKR